MIEIPRGHLPTPAAARQHLAGDGAAEVDAGEMKEAIASGEVELMTTPLGKWFWREELMAKALETWPLDLIEDALGAEAQRVLPHALRTAELRVRLSRHHVAMLEYRAEQWETTVSGVLAREMDGVASAHRGAVGRDPGFRQGDGVAGAELAIC